MMQSLLHVIRVGQQPDPRSMQAATMRPFYRVLPLHVSNPHKPFVGKRGSNDSRSSCRIKGCVAKRQLAHSIYSYKTGKLSQAAQASLLALMDAFNALRTAVAVTQRVMRPGQRAGTGTGPPSCTPDPLPLEALRLLSALSSACSRSFQMSSTSSTPQLSRTRLSLMLYSARFSGPWQMHPPFVSPNRDAG